MVLLRHCGPYCPYLSCTRTVPIYAFDECKLSSVPPKPRGRAVRAGLRVSQIEQERKKWLFAPTLTATKVRNLGRILKYSEPEVIPYDICELPIASVLAEVISEANAHPDFQRLEGQKLISPSEDDR